MPLSRIVAYAHFFPLRLSPPITSTPFGQVPSPTGQPASYSRAPRSILLLATMRVGSKRRLCAGTRTSGDGASMNTRLCLMSAPCGSTVASASRHWGTTRPRGGSCRLHVEEAMCRTWSFTFLGTISKPRSSFNLLFLWRSTRSAPWQEKASSPPADILVSHQILLAHARRMLGLAISEEHTHPHTQNSTCTYIYELHIQMKSWCTNAAASFSNLIIAFLEFCPNRRCECVFGIRPCTHLHVLW